MSEYSTAEERVAERSRVLWQWFFDTLLPLGTTSREWVAWNTSCHSRIDGRPCAWESGERCFCEPSALGIDLYHRAPMRHLRLAFPIAPEAVTDDAISVLAESVATVLAVPVGAVRGWLLTGEVPR